MTSRGYATAWSCSALLVVMSLGQALCKAPLMRIIELNLCRSFYEINDPKVIGPDDYVDEYLCKILPVQENLATVNAYTLVFSALIELLTAFPYASLSDRLDRRVILAANAASSLAALSHTMCICYFYRTFNPKLIWLQPLYRVIGGGDSVMLSLANALIAETVPQANLSKILFSLNAMRLFVNSASQSGGGALMQLNLWLPVLIGLPVHILAIPTLFLIEDPRSPRLKPLTNAAEEADSQSLLGGSRPSSRVSSDTKSVIPSIPNVLRAIVILWRDPIAAMTMGIFFWNELGHCVNNIVQQWTSKTFSWSLASTNYFLSGQRLVAGVTLVLLTSTVHRLQVVGIPNRHVDIGIICFTQLSTLLGIFGAALSSSLPSHLINFSYVISILVYMMGWGMAGALQSFVTRVIHKNHITWLYTGLNVAERMASIIAGPIYAGLLAEGFRRGGSWVYLPYFVSGSIFILVSGLTLRLMRRLEWLETHHSA